MKSGVIDFIKKARRRFDGAMGTMLMKEGLETGDCPELAPADILVKVHKAYVEAGAQFLTTNTFGANKPKLSKYQKAELLADINRRNVEAALEAARGRDDVYVAGDVGPTGEFPEPYGSFSQEDFIKVFTEQAEALAEAGADLIIIETMTALEEASAAVKAAKAATSLPVFATMTFNLTEAAGYRTMMGASPEDAVKALRDAGADVIGANCTLTPAEIVGLAGELKGRADCPVLIQPNAGKPRVDDGRTVYDPIPDLKTRLKEILDAGADIIGGCCGTEPDYVRLVRTVMNED